VKITLEQAMKAQSGSRSVALPFFNLGARRRWAVSATLWLLYLREGDLVPILQDTGWTPGQVQTGAKNLAPPLGFNPRAICPVARRYTVSSRPTIRYCLQTV